jgi:hypothetical protein
MMPRRRSRTIPVLVLAAACLLLVPAAAVGGNAAPDAVTAALAVSKEGTGTGRVTSLPPGIDCGQTCASSFPDGSTVTLIANADDGSSFVSWSGACSGTNPTCTVVMSAPLAVTAKFDAILPPPSGPPVVGKDVNVVPVSGTVLVKLPGRTEFVTLNHLAQIPMRSVIDTLKGRVRLKSALRRGKFNQSDFYQGLFRVYQRRKAGSVTDLVLIGSLTGCNALSPQSVEARKRRRLWGSGKGSFRTKGRYSAAVVRGTKWLVEDRCDSTVTTVSRGVVEVQDFVQKKIVRVRAGQRYVARRRAGR